MSTELAEKARNSNRKIIKDNCMCSVPKKNDSREKVKI